MDNKEFEFKSFKPHGFLDLSPYNATSMLNQMFYKVIKEKETEINMDSTVVDLSKDLMIATQVINDYINSIFKNLVLNGYIEKDNFEQVYNTLLKDFDQHYLAYLIYCAKPENKDSISRTPFYKI